MSLYISKSFSCFQRVLVYCSCVPGFRENLFWYRLFNRDETVDRVIVSTSPTYSLVMDKQMNLAVSWRTEMKFVVVGLTVGVILPVIIVSAVLIRRSAPLLPPLPLL